MRIKKIQDVVGAVGSMATEYTESSNAYYNAPYINNINEYSTEETFTGQYWIDGKPIYRKVISVNSPSSSGVYATIANMGSNVVDTLVSAKSMILVNYSESNQVFYNLNIDERDSIHYCLIAYNKSNGDIQAKVGTEFVSKKITIVLEYTKTTD